MNTNLTEIVFLLDRSGSMEGLEKDTIGGFNSFINNQCRLVGDTIVTTVLFDDKYEILWNGVDAKKIRLTDKEYFVRGSTALLDAIGKTILDLKFRLLNTEDYKKPGKVIFVITTDGLENSSCEFTYKKIKELINHHKEKYRWDFIFLGANIDTYNEANNIGIDSHDTFIFDASKEGVEKMYSMIDNTVSEKRFK